MDLFSPRHLIIILVVVLLVFGTKKLRTIGSDLGAAVRGFKKSMNEGDQEQQAAQKQLPTDAAKDAEFRETARRRHPAAPGRPARLTRRAFAMFDIGFSEILLIFGLTLVVLGPDKLPQVARTIGRWAGRARAMARQFRDQLRGGNRQLQGGPERHRHRHRHRRRTRTAASREHGTRQHQPPRLPRRRDRARRLRPRLTRPHPIPRRMTGESEPLLEGTLISHLLELRTRLMRAFIAVVLVFVPLAFYSNQLFEWLSHPLLQQLPANSMLISTSITAPFTTPLKLSFVAALVVAMPYVLYELWAFVAPGLYRHEKSFAVPLLVSVGGAVLRRHRLRLLPGVPADLRVLRQHHAARRADDGRHHPCTWSSC